jgi:methionine-rich copper-binding protein CopC
MHKMVKTHKIGAWIFATTTLFAVTATTSSWANVITASSPAQNAIITTTPNVVSITTDEAINDQGSSLQVIDPNGNEVDDHSLTVSGSTAVIGMQSLTTTGVYKVIYNLYFQSNAPLIGNYSFTFNGPGAISAATSTATTTPTTTPSQSNSQSPSSKQPNLNSSAGNAFVYGLMLSGLIVALALLWYAYILMERNKSHRKKASRPTVKSK